MFIIIMLKKYGLKECVKGFCRIIDRKLGMPFSFINYKFNLAFNRPYFGQYLAARQGCLERYILMEKLVETEKKDCPYNILEVGSWAGGSAILWGKAVKKRDAGGTVICVDPWVNYIDGEKNNNYIHRIMTKALKYELIFELFQHNIKFSGVGDSVFSFRGKSDDRLPMLKKNQFDLVYIDGDHSYPAMFNDLKNSKDLVKEGGVICGDDLELQYNVIDINTAKSLKAHDFVQDPKTGTFYHPGVTLSIWEFFKTEISEKEGFWAMRKTKYGWEKINL